MRNRPIKAFKDIPEQWRRYKDTNYWVSDQGRVKHVYKNGKEHECGWLDKKKTHQLMVKINGKDIKLDRLVYKTFKGEIPKGMALIHKNGLKRDNSIYNLKLVTPEYCGKHYGHKSKSQKVYCKENNMIYRSARAVERYLPLNRQSVTDICNGKTKKPLMDLYWYDEENDEIYRGKYRKETI